MKTLKSIHWIELAKQLARANFTIQLSWFGEKEKKECLQIVKACPKATLLKVETNKK